VPCEAYVRGNGAFRYEGAFKRIQKDFETNKPEEFEIINSSEIERVNQRSMFILLYVETGGQVRRQRKAQRLAGA
jgi:hypothetical protein